MMKIKPAEFIEKLIKNKGIPIKLYDYQKKILEDMADFRIVNKSRQIGISQLIAWEALAKALLEKNKTILVISRSERQAKEVLSYIKNAYYSIDPEVRYAYKTTEESKTALTFAMTNSRILSLPNSPSSIRGFRGDDIYVDEFAHFLNDTEIWNSILPMISRGGKITLVSTPLGKRGLFHKIWQNSIEGINSYSRHEIFWQQCPDIQKMIKEIKKSMDDIQFKQEYCCEFVDEGICMFTWDMICDVVDSTLKPDYTPRDKNPIFFGIDFGKKVDSTVLYAIEKTKNLIKTKFIREFKNPEYKTYESHLREIRRLIREVKPDFVSIDKGQAGQRIFEELKKDFGGGMIKGVDFTMSTKETMIVNLKFLFQDLGIVIPDDYDLKSQLHTIEKYVSESGLIRYRHKKKRQHDDYVWALALACDVARGKKESKVIAFWTNPRGGKKKTVSKSLEGMY